MHVISIVTITSAALSCGAFALVVTAGSGKNNAPLATAAAPDALLAQTIAPDNKADRLPLFGDRFGAFVPQPIPPGYPNAAAPARPLPQATAADEAQARAEASRSVKPVKQARAEARDLCQRHGMHKHYTRGGRSWRCRK